MKESSKDIVWNFQESDVQAVLNAIPGSNRTNFSQSAWSFQCSKKTLTIIDFVDIYELKNRYPAWYKTLNVDPIKVSKLAWLDCASLYSPMSWKQRLSGITLFWTALAEINVTRVSLDNISELLTYLLTHSWRNGKQHSLKRIQSYTSFTSMFSIPSWRPIFNVGGFEIISPSIGSNGIAKALKLLIPKLTNEELTLADWMDGGSTNHLTLDYGQYYIEHCLQVFEEHIALATAIDLTFKNVPTFSKDANLNAHTTGRVVTMMLEGFSADETWTRLSRPNALHSNRTIEQIHRDASAYFEKTYRSLSFRDFILKSTSLKKILESMNIDPSQDQIDRTKLIVWYWLENRIEEALYLMETSKTIFSWRVFEVIFLLMKVEHGARRFTAPHEDYYKTIGLYHSDSSWDTLNRYPRQLVRLVQQAGLTSIVALTGWRRSEFGFPLAAVKHQPNYDVLDQSAFPVRCHVEWYVPKTHGEELTNREITFDIALLAERLGKLNGGKNGDPCLYRCNENAADRNNSSAPVARSVTGPWRHFVENYSGFQTLKDLESWRNVTEMVSEILTQCSSHYIEKERLLSIRSADEWNSLFVDNNLKSAWIRARTELPIIEFIFFKAGSDRKTSWLEKYAHGSLPLEWSNLINSRLSVQTREWIKSLDVTELRLSTVVRAVTLELLEDCLYPTPHSFRHMFVEAIYRRFDGDVGWLIRSQFKHISKAMWLAYIKDKFNRSDHQLGKIRVVSSLVNNYIKNEGEGYAGSMNTWLRRLIRNTSVMTPDEQMEFANRISTVEITDIKASPWGYCLLKRRTQSKARCAEYGEPQRHNASPELCLSCVHNLMQSDNVEWIILHINTHVEALKNPLVPKLFQMSSYNLVKDATKHVRMLNPNHEALYELQQVLDAYCEAA